MTKSTFFRRIIFFSTLYLFFISTSSAQNPSSMSCATIWFKADNSIGQLSDSVSSWALGIYFVEISIERKAIKVIKVVKR